MTALDDQDNEITRLRSQIEEHESSKRELQTQVFSKDKQIEELHRKLCSEKNN